MSDNGSGVYSPNTAGQPVVGGTDITDTVFNNLINDIATALTNRIAKDGQTTVTQNIPFNGKKITGLGLGTASTDAASLANLILTLATPQVSTSGTAIDFTGIPADTRRVTVMFNEISTSGTSVIRVQLGDAGGFEVTGYAGSVDNANGGNPWATSSGIDLNPSTTAAVTYSGVLTLTLLNSTTNVWAAHGMLARTDSNLVSLTAGRKALSAVLTQVRITTVNGSDTFDAGEINIAYE